MSDALHPIAWEASCALDNFKLEIDAVGEIAGLLSSAEFLDGPAQNAFRGIRDTLLGLSARVNAKSSQFMKMRGDAQDNDKPIAPASFIL